MEHRFPSSLPLPSPLQAGGLDYPYAVRSGIGSYGSLDRLESGSIHGWEAR